MGSIKFDGITAMDRRRLLQLGYGAGMGALMASAPIGGLLAADDTFQSVVQKAKEEGKLVVGDPTVPNPNDQAQIFAAFKSRFGLDKLDAAWLPIFQGDAAARVIAAGKTSKAPADVFSGLVQQFEPVANAGLIDSYDWLGVFGNQLAGLDSAVQSVPAAWRGKVLDYWSSAFVLAFNTQQIKEADVPDSMEELADPKWKGKFILNGTGSPLFLLSLLWGKEKTLDQAKKLLANQPVIKTGGPAAVASLVNGEAPLTPSSLAAVEGQIAKGAPVGSKYFKDYVPVLPLQLYVPSNASNPNAGRLFAAWLSSEGMPLLYKTTKYERATDPRSTTYKYLQEHKGSKLVMPASPEDWRVVNGLLEELPKMIQAGAK